MLAHIFEKFDSPLFANWVLRKSATNCKDYIEQYIENNFYMDDLCQISNDLMPNEEDLIQLLAKLLIILSNCEFRLTKFLLSQ